MRVYGPSGHAYGTALGAVTSCVGSDWCRYGVQDAFGLAIDLEMRHRGLRAPPTLTSGVSGCGQPRPVPPVPLVPRGRELVAGPTPAVVRR